MYSHHTLQCCKFYWALMLSLKVAKEQRGLGFGFPLLSVGMAERVPFILKSPGGWVAAWQWLPVSLAPHKKANFMEFKFG